MGARLTSSRSFGQKQSCYKGLESTLLFSISQEGKTQRDCKRCGTVPAYRLFKQTVAGALKTLMCLQVRFLWTLEILLESYSKIQ